MFLLTINSEKTFVLGDGTALDTGDERMFKADKLIEDAARHRADAEAQVPQAK